MDIEEFVANVLIDLDKAVEKARSQTNRDISFSQTSEARTVEFDIAVSVEEADKKSGKAGVRVLQFAEGGGELSKESKNSTVSRIKFGLHVDSVTKEEKQRMRGVVNARPY